MEDDRKAIIAFTVTAIIIAPYVLWRILRWMVWTCATEIVIPFGRKDLRETRKNSCVPDRYEFSRSLEFNMGWDHVGTTHHSALRELSRKELAKHGGVGN